MNILILNWRDIKNPKSGGAEIVTMEHAKAWVKRGHKVTWFTSNFEKGKSGEIINGVNIIRRGNFITVFLNAALFYLLSGQSFDLVIDEIHGLPFFTPLYVRRPKIAFIHEVAGGIWDYMFPFPINKVGKLVEPPLYFLYRNIQFITVSNSTAEELINLGIKKKNINIIINGLNVKSFKRFPLKEKFPTFIFVSRVVKMKGIEEVTRAFFYILKNLRDAKLWIVGDGEESYLNDLKETMKTYSISPKVKFFGKVSEQKKFELIQRSHVLLHASIKEGWGLVVIEAASQGTPSVVYNVSGLRDSVKDERTGIVLKKNNAKEMAKEAINLVKDSKRYRIFQENGLSWAKSLTWDKSTNQSLKLINSIVKQ